MKLNHSRYSLPLNVTFIRAVLCNGNWTEWSAVWSKSYAWFQNWTSAQREFDLKSQVWFHTKIAQHEVQLPLYYIHCTCNNLICYFKQDLKPVWSCCFSEPFSLAGKKVRFGNISHCWEPIRLNESPVISKWMK